MQGSKLFNMLVIQSALVLGACDDGSDGGSDGLGETGTAESDGPKAGSTSGDDPNVATEGTQEPSTSDGETNDPTTGPGTTTANDDGDDDDDDDDASTTRGTTTDDDSGGSTDDGASGLECSESASPDDTCGCPCCWVLNCINEDECCGVFAEFCTPA